MLWSNDLGDVITPAGPGAAWRKDCCTGIALQCPQDTEIVHENLPDKRKDTCHHRKDASWNSTLSCSRGSRGASATFLHCRDRDRGAQEGAMPGWPGYWGLHSPLAVAGLGEEAVGLLCAKQL